MRSLDPLEVGSAFLRGGARLLQIRQKSRTRSDLLAVTRHALAEGRPLGARIFVNDRADIAAMAGADGVHVGQDDLSVADVRRIAGPAIGIGLSTHTTAQVDEALRHGVAYVAVGPVFRTGSKDTGYEPRGLDLVRYAAGKGTPIVAIGGITLDRAPDVVNAGADAVAVISDLLGDQHPAARVAQYLDTLSD